MGEPLALVSGTLQLLCQKRGCQSQVPSERRGVLGRRAYCFRLTENEKVFSDKQGIKAVAGPSGSNLRRSECSIEKSPLLIILVQIVCGKWNSKIILVQKKV